MNRNKYLQIPMRLLHILLMALCLIALGPVKLVSANDAEWSDIGGAADSSATQDETTSTSSISSTSSASDTTDEWQVISAGNTGDPQDYDTAVERISDVERQISERGAPLLTTIDVPLAESLLAKEEQPAIAPSIIEFGDEGSGQSSEQGNIQSSNLVSSEQSDVSDHLPPPIAQTNLDMFAGELRVLGKVDVTRVAIGDGGIVRVEVLNTGELLLIAQQEGSTSLRLWNKDTTQSAYNIRVSAKDMETRVRMERMVRMRVRLVEFRKSAVGKLGVDWVDEAVGPTLSAAGDAIGNNLFRPITDGFESLPNRVQPFSTYFGIASSITSKINFLTQNGDAVTLAEPVLSAMNGGKASFLAGGQVPYPAASEGGNTTVEFKDYGIKLDVAPLIDSAGNVRTFVETEISQLDSSLTVNDVPGLLTRRAQTEVNVKSGETIVISGLLSSESGKDVDMIPGIGRLPIIGRLFSSENKRNTVTELVIFVTPEVIEPSQPFNTARENQRYDDTTKRLREARQQLPLME